MSEEDRNAMGHAIMRDLGPEALAGEGVSLYDAYQRAWQSALAWERGRQKVLWEGYLKISSDGLGAFGFFAPTSRDDATRVKIVEAE